MRVVTGNTKLSGQTANQTFLHYYLIYSFHIMKILMNAALKSKVTPDNKVQKNEERVRNKEIT